MQNIGEPNLQPIRYAHCDRENCFFQLRLGGDRNFGYLLGDPSSRTAAAVDPGFMAERFVEAADAHNLRITKILITHAHSDHVDAAQTLAGITGARLYAGYEENVTDASVVRDGEPLELGKKSIIAFHTPGHSAGHLCFLFEKRLVTGDLLFCGKVGGTGPHFPGSSPEQEWRSLRRITSLPEEVLVFPGHDYYGGQGEMAHSSIGYEKQNNPFLLCKDLEAFLDLKKNWDTYKRQHGIR
jgi:hydroxyacylglutathione hydrolase